MTALLTAGLEDFAAEVEAVEEPPLTPVVVTVPALEVLVSMALDIVLLAGITVEVVELGKTVEVELKTEVVLDVGRVETCETFTVVVTGLVSVPLIANGKEYWKMVGSESKESFRPKAAKLLRDVGMAQT